MFSLMHWWAGANNSGDIITPVFSGHETSSFAEIYSPEAK